MDNLLDQRQVILESKNVEAGANGHGQQEYKQGEEHRKRRKHHRSKESTFLQKISYAWTHATVGPVFFFFLAAYMLQTSIISSHIHDRLRHQYNVSFCEIYLKNHSEFMNSKSVHREKIGGNITVAKNVEIHGAHDVRKRASAHNAHEIDSEKHEDLLVESCHLSKENFEEDLSHWNLALFFIYAVPALILAPIFGSWTDGLHRVIPMYTCVLGLTISSLCSGVAIIMHAPILDIVLTVLPSGLTGGAVLFSIAMYSYEAEKNDNFDIFESYLILQCLQMASRTLVQVLVYLCSSSSTAKSLLLWCPLVFSLISAFGLLHRRIKDPRKINFNLGRFAFYRYLCFHFPKDFLHLIKFRLWAMHISLFVCAFVFYFAFVGETAEIMNVLEKGESWQIASFSLYGAAQNAVESVGLLLTLYVWKNIIHKKIIDEELLPHFSVFLLGILGYASDMLTKVIVSVTPISTVQYWEPLIGVIAELSIVVVRYFSVLLVEKPDVGKVLSLVAVAQTLATIPAAYSAKAIHVATANWWSSSVYLFLALIQLIPIALIIFIMKSTNLPEIDLRPEKEEESKDGDKETEH